MKKEFGYILPEVIDPSETVCFQVNVPKDRNHIAAFMGQMHELTRWYNWQPDEEHTAIQVAEVWKQIYEVVRTTADECGVDMFDIRQKPDSPCIIQKQTDGATWVDAVNIQLCPPNIRVNKGIIEWFNPETGEWEEVDSGDERFDGDAPPPYPDNPDGACLAAENLTAIYQTTLTQLRAGVVAGEVAVALAATLTGILSLFIPAALISTAALAISGIALDAGESYLGDMLDTESLDNFKCSIYCNIESDGSVTASDYTALYSDMATWATGLELSIIQYYLDSLGSVGLTRQGTAGGVTTGDCEACDCEDEEHCPTYTDFAGGMGDWVFWLATDAPNPSYPSGETEIGTFNTAWIDFEDDPRDDFQKISIGKSVSLTSIEKMKFVVNSPDAGSMRVYWWFHVAGGSWSAAIDTYIDVVTTGVATEYVADFTATPIVANIDTLLLIPYCSGNGGAKLYSVEICQIGE